MNRNGLCLVLPVITPPYHPESMMRAKKLKKYKKCANCLACARSRGGRESRVMVNWRLEQKIFAEKAKSRRIA